MRAESRFHVMPGSAKIPADWDGAGCKGSEFKDIENKKERLLESEEDDNGKWGGQFIFTTSEQVVLCRRSF